MTRVHFVPIDVSHDSGLCRFFIGMHGTGVLLILSDLYCWRKRPYVLLKQII
jgi:hypothetical protein